MREGRKGFKRGMYTVTISMNVRRFVKIACRDGADIENSTGITKSIINSYCKKSSSTLEFLTLAVVSLGSIQSQNSGF